MHNPRRLLWALGALTLLAGTGITVAQSEGAVVHPHASEAGWGALRPMGAVQPHSDPAHFVGGLSPHTSGTVQTDESTNWSGYFDSANGTQFTGASAQWVVPTVQPSQNSLFSSTWVGVDGVGNSSLIQTGTSQDTTGGATDYYAWFEILPASAVRIGAVSPGDHMQASVQQSAPGSTLWTITITDLTSAATLSEPVNYTGPGSSAEWIEEAPTVNGEQSALANFGTAQFTNIGETTVPAASAVTHTAVDMIESSSPNAVIASPGPLVNGSFTVTDDTSTPPPTTPPTSPPTSLPTTPSTTTPPTTPPTTPTTTPPTTTPHGYWLVGSDGGIFTFGSGQFYGSTGSLDLQRPVVDMTLTADQKGYWLVASDGGVFTFGDAVYHGSVPQLGYAPAGTPGAVKKLNAPIVGMVPTTDGGGYFMVASDGGVFAFGDANFEGSCPGIGGCSGPGVTVMPDVSGGGYWLVTATGHIYTFGNAGAFGSPGPQGSPVTSAARTPDGNGYWILLANGTVDTFGDASNLGSPLNQTSALNPATAIIPTTDGQGYWVTSAEGAVFPFGDAPNYGNLSATRLNGAIIAGTGF
jgi:hypothetical protein